MTGQLDLPNALRAVENCLNEAARRLAFIQDPPEYSEYLDLDVDVVVERAFLTLLLLSETMELEHFRDIILCEYEKARQQKNGIGAAEADSSGDLQLLADAQIRNLVEAFKGIYGLDEGRSARTVVDILDVLRNTEYSLVSPKAMTSPANESELHERIEAILRCVYPDLKHKPTISKPIKNFEPDTGIPSIKTLIEYKYVADQMDVARVSDEILADTQGYRSRDWNRFIYLIYETSRLQSEKKWSMHLEECGRPRNTDVVVIRGDRPAKSSAKRARIDSKKPVSPASPKRSRT